MFYCKLKGESCPHLRKTTRTIAPEVSKQRGTCLVCSKLPRTKNIIEIVNGGLPFYHNATCCPEK